MKNLFLLGITMVLSLHGTAQKLKWDRTTVNFGNVRDWNSPEAVFTFQNTGNSELMFLPQRHDREVLVRYPDRAIEPGGTGVIIIRYYTGRTGPFSRTVDVYTNASQRPEKLTVKGNIKSIYADALTACSTFYAEPTVRKSTPNVIQVVDAVTQRPIPGAQVEVYDRGLRKAVNGTNADGVAVNWVEPGSYMAVVFKGGYEKQEQELSFTKRSRTFVIPLQPKYQEQSRVLAEQDVVNRAEPEPQAWEQIDLGIALNDQIEQEQPTEAEPEEWNPGDLGIATNAQWAEAETDAEPVQPEAVGAVAFPVEQTRVPEPQEHTDAFDLGITTNEVWEEQSDRPATEPDAQEVERQVEAALSERMSRSEAQPEPEPVAGPEFSKERFRPNNVLLLLDVSGSMREDGKMDRLKAAVKRLVRMLRDVDVLTIIAYNSSSWQVLAPTAVVDNEQIVALVDSLRPEGYTNGVKGMETAYASLEQQRIEGGNNQLIIATDGKFNSSKFSEKEAVQLVRSHSEKGIALSIIGFGDDKEATRMMRKLAREGNGSFMQISEGQDPTELLAEEIKNRSRLD